jgi:stage V sporulation protein B
MAKRKRRSNFIVQGTILAVAGLIVRIIGLIYRIPLTNMIGDEGMGYYSFAYEPYSVMLLLSYHGLPTAVSKLVAQYNGSGRYRNSYRVFRAGLCVAAGIGFVTGLFMWFGAGFIADTLNHQPMSAFALKVLGPTLFILSIMGILRGYFQGMGTMVPTAVSQVFEAIVNAIVSLVAAYYLFRAGRRFDLVTGSASHAEGYGAAGGTIGTLAGAVTALLFLLFVLAVYKSVLSRRFRKDHTGGMEEYRTIGQALFLIAAPVIGSSILFNISTTLDGMIFSGIMQSVHKISKDVVASSWGIFTNKYKIMIMIPVAISTALATSIVPDFSEEMTAGNRGRVAKKVHFALRFSMIVAIPCAVGLSVLSEPILTLLFNPVTASDIQLLRFGSLAAVAYSFSTISNAVLQGINELKRPLIHAGISLVVHLALLAFLVGVCKAGIYGVMVSYIVFAVLICALNTISIQRVLPYQQEWKKTFLLPVICSVIMGVAVFGVHTGVGLLTEHRLPDVLCSIVVGVVIYGVLLILSRAIEEEDLYHFPRGEKIVGVVRKLHLIH